MLARKFVPALAVLSCSALALAADATTEDLKAQIDALQKKVEALEAKQVSASDVDLTVQRVLADAQRRSHLMQAEGFTAGYNKGKFTLQSADGNFSWTPTAQLQVRYVGSYREIGEPDGGDSYEDGFEIRRMKFGMIGNVVSPDLTYKFQWATDRNSGDPVLEDAWFRYNLNRNFAVFAGQWEDLHGKESATSSGRQLAVEQSYANRVLIDEISDYTQGAGVTYHTQMARVSVALTDGANSDNTNFTNHEFGGTTVYWGASARGELMVLGDNWKAYDDFTALNNQNDLLVLGAGASYSDAAQRDIVLYSVDAQYEPQAVAGLSLFGAVIGNDADGSGGNPDVDNIGFVAQAGYLFTARWEVFARYDMINFDSIVVTDDDTVPEYTLGVNYYLNGHAAKFTADVVYLPDGAPFAESGLGILASRDQEVVGRVQFQILL